MYTVVSAAVSWGGESLAFSLRVSQFSHFDFLKQSLYHSSSVALINLKEYTIPKTSSRTCVNEHLKFSHAGMAEGGQQGSGERCRSKVISWYNGKKDSYMINFYFWYLLKIDEE